MPRPKAIGATFHESICNDLEIFYDQPTLGESRLGHSRGRAGDRAHAFARRLHGRPHQHLPPGGHRRVRPRHAEFCHRSAAAGRSTSNVTVYHAQPYSHRDPLGNLVEPELVVDTTDLIEQKKKMLAKHASQKRYELEPHAAGEPDSGEGQASSESGEGRISIASSSGSGGSGPGHVPREQHVEHRDEAPSQRPVGVLEAARVLESHAEEHVDYRQAGVVLRVKWRGIGIGRSGQSGGARLGTDDIVRTPRLAGQWRFGKESVHSRHAWTIDALESRKRAASAGTYRIADAHLPQLEWLQVKFRLSYPVRLPSRSEDS